MELKKLMNTFRMLFLISLLITIGLFIALKKMPISQETDHATVVSCERISHSKPTYGAYYSTSIRGWRVTVRYGGHENKCYHYDETAYYRPGMRVHVYIAPDGSLGFDEDMARANSILGKMYFVFFAITGILFLAFMTVYDKIWRIKHGKQNKEGKV
ncbi:MAG: hypothetical protein K2K17_01085 [Lachnospiraceae bacterium]|nr:hypothetical protein [Lachnospiraceae bacterium]